MRIWRVGILVLLLASVLWAQAEGTVESVGFQGYYRPECWVPMTVLLRPTTDSAAELQIRVVQEDLDRDRVLATRTVTLSPDPSGRQSEQRFWMYFRPQPTNDGLHDAAVGGSPKKLEQELKVLLTDSGGKTISSLPITQQGIRRVDVDPRSGAAKDVRGAKVVLCVSDGTSLPARQEYENVDGLAEMPLFIVLRPRDLPEDIRGYEMVDSILWLGSTAPDPKKPTEEPRYRALEQYVRQGGMLVVVQGQEMAQTRGFEPLLPVKVTEYRESKSLDPLPTMGKLDWQNGAPEEAANTRRVAFASAKPDALVVRSKQWEDKTTSPYLVRWRVGAGCVTWVAQDLGEPSVVRSLRKGWVSIWDEVMGWRNAPTPRQDALQAKPGQDAKVGPYGDALAKGDLGPSFKRGGSDLTLKASGYVLMAVLFFAVYWVVSGPGLYAFLSLKKMATLNWFLFGVAAVVAALVATLVVRVVRSGAPQLQHVTILRVPAGGNATVQSRVGLYIKSDRPSMVELQKGAPQTTNWVTPFPEHPSHMADTGSFLAMQQYTLPIQDSSSDEPVRVEIPCRYTMKWMQVKWNGDFEGRIDGQVSLTGRSRPEIRGALVNSTPWTLHHIYMAYRGMRTEGDGSNTGGDRVIYIPEWKQGDRIDLAQLLLSDDAYQIGTRTAFHEDVPRRGKVIYGGMELIHYGLNEAPGGEGWVSWWYAANSDLNSRSLNDLRVNDASSAYEVSLPICSLFDRIPPMRNERKDGVFNNTRKDILRVGARALNVSPAVASGSMVITAQAQGPLPVPLTVEGETPTGDGVIFCQFILPLGRPGPEMPATTQAAPPARVNVEK